MSKDIKDTALCETVSEKEKEVHFEIVIRGMEVYRINTETKEIERVFQIIDKCVRGDAWMGSFSDEFVFDGHRFSMIGKINKCGQYIINVFCAEEFKISIECCSEKKDECKKITAEYEECLEEYTASFIVEKEKRTVKIWITIN